MNLADLRERTLVDIGLTHVALPVGNIARSIAFYARYARMQVVHHRKDPDTAEEVVWLSDQTRPFVIVLIRADPVYPVLTPFAHLGVGCPSREVVDTLCHQAQSEGILVQGPTDSGPPVGYWAFIRDPDGHTLELAFGQEIGLIMDDVKHS